MTPSDTCDFGICSRDCGCEFGGTPQYPFAPGRDRLQSPNKVSGHGRPSEEIFQVSFSIIINVMTSLFYSP